MLSGTCYATRIEGTWKAKMKGPNGNMELTFVFKLTDGKWSGVVRAPNRDTEITNTEIKGKKFSFVVSFIDMTISLIDLMSKLTTEHN